MKKLSEERIRYYDDYLSEEIYQKISGQLKSINGVEGLEMTAEPRGLENTKSLQFLCRLFECVHPHLKQVLNQRIEDRKFIDDRVKALYETNTELGLDYFSTDYESIMGLQDAKGRTVIGPLLDDYCTFDASKEHAKVAPVPEYLQGNHVTLFGPPDTKKMAINAMNSFHRKLQDEPKVVEELLKGNNEFPKWGADDEDSKTPMHDDLVSAGENLTHCFTKEIKVDDDPKGKYKLQAEKLALPIKRFPGLALPSFFAFYKDQPIPLHLYDFALHFFANWNRNEALVFYVPKLENEEEARYIRSMLETAETLMKEIHPEYEMGTIRLMIVLENPRAVFRVHEMMDELYPYFAGMSLGWHDYLGSAARLFKEDPNYRIPVKADPDIVIKYIKGSHDLLANVVGPRGGIKVGGMYGILPLDNDRWGDSFQATLKGFFRDVITQMKRDLTGYWVAHPDFVRIGMAIVEAWKLYAKDDKQPLYDFISGLLRDDYQNEVVDFLEGADIEGLDPKDPLYPRSLIVADVGESNIIQNNDPEEIRYNVFQSLQYITDWLSGNGCVALPAFVSGSSVRVMDDLATAERSRWEVWHELYHSRFELNDFLKIAFEEFNFIRKDLSNEKKIVQVKWNANNEKWYPVALRLMIKLMTDREPVEFATQLLLPFTLDKIQKSEKPWEAIQELDDKKYHIDPYVERFIYYFERCGEVNFASSMAKDLVFEEKKCEELIKSFQKEEIIQAASFHGDIGRKKNLDALAKSEQANVSEEDQATKDIVKLAGEYLEKFGFKFLVSAKGKSSAEMLEILQGRINNTAAEEIENARQALFEITMKRVHEEPLNQLSQSFIDLKKKYDIPGAQIAISNGYGDVQQISLGKEVDSKTLFEIASLSKTIGTCLALEVLKNYDIDENCLVIPLLREYGSPIQLDDNYADSLCLKHLMSHSALNMHYVNGIPKSEAMPEITELLKGHESYGYEATKVLHTPGTKFQYSGAGFMLLEHILELVTKKSIAELSRPWFDQLGLKAMTFEHTGYEKFNYIDGYHKTGEKIEGERLKFPSFAAGGYATAENMQVFLEELTRANLHCTDTKISHATASKMLFGRDDHSQLGSLEFMQASVGLGLFVVEADENKWALHQGANDGFRAIYLHCFEGPDTGKGLTIFSHGGLNGVEFISHCVQQILEALQVQGVDFNYYKHLTENFNKDGILPEEVVNQGYKKLVFDAFAPNLPPEISRLGEKVDPLLDKSLIKNAQIESVTNQRFALAKNIFSIYTPTFDPELFCPQGKVMDSWESARHNPKDFDELIFTTSENIKVSGIYLSTMYHLGNQVERVSLDYFYDDKWFTLLPETTMQGHSFRKVKLKNEIESCRFRLRVAPDGGFSRLALFDQVDDEFVLPSESQNTVHSEEIPAALKPLSLPVGHLRNKKEMEEEELFNNSSRAFGAEVLEASNEHYGPAEQVISPTPPIHMFDGLESARSREPDHSEFVTIKLAKESSIHSCLLDFKFFVNNNPVFISLEALNQQDEWQTLLHKEKVKFYAGNKAYYEFKEDQNFKQVRLTTYPDGGVNRIKVFSPWKN